jgi:hypothetical protein
VSRLHRIDAGSDRTRGSVIFVHGLGGDPITTWGGNNIDAPEFWPRWLAKDIPDLAIYSLAYEAEPSKLNGSAMSLIECGQNTLAQLRTERALQDAPIAFVCHSLGGLVVKQLMRCANERKETDAEAARLLDRIAQVVFIATPHLGSKIPIIMRRLGSIARPTVIIEDLTNGDRHLLDLYRWYTNYCDPRSRTIEHLVFRETKPTHGLMVVEEASSFPGVAGAQFTPLGFDHIEICKPANREAEVYKTTRKFLARLSDAKPHSAKRRTSDAPQGPIVHLEVRPVPGFKGREEELAYIGAALWGGSDVGRAALTNSNAAVLFGIGGKSVLAQEYAWRNRERYAGVWWLRAKEIETLIDELLELGKTWLIERLPDDRTKALHLILAQLSKTATKPWLLVYDNVEKPEAITKLMPAEGAHALITTRWSNWRGYASEINVGVLPQSLSIEFLRGQSQLGDHEAAGRLADTLGYLPLALAQARAYCRATGSSFDECRAKLPEPIRKSSHDTDYPDSVFATFDLALTAMAKRSAVAETLMELLAFFAPDSIPLNLVSKNIMTENERDEAVATLREISLLELRSSTRSASTVTVHRLLQEVMRARLSETGSQTRVAAEALRLVSREAMRLSMERDCGYRNSVEAAARNALLLPHALAVLAHAPREATADWDRVQVLEHVGDMHRDRGDLSPALAAYCEGLDLAQYVTKANGNTSWQGRGCYLLCGKIGDLLFRQGNYAEALDARRRTLSMAKRLAAAHPDDPYFQGGLCESHDPTLAEDDLAYFDDCIERMESKALPLKAVGDRRSAQSIV